MSSSLDLPERVPSFSTLIVAQVVCNIVILLKEWGGVDQDFALAFMRLSPHAVFESGSALLVDIPYDPCYGIALRLR